VSPRGTAVANLHPGVLEAHHSCVPLLLLTADRPDELRGIRSNQTTVQPGIYAGAVRLSEDVPAPSGAPGEPALACELAKRAWLVACGTETHNPGPVHLNLAFRAPLSSAVAPLSVDPRIGATEGDRLAQHPSIVSHRLPRPYPSETVVTVNRQPHTIVVAGNNAGEEAEEFARVGGWPLLAEVTSGARFGPNLIVAARDLLRNPEFGGRVKQLVVFGHPTLTREVPALVEQKNVHTIVVSPVGTEWFNPGRRVKQFARSVTVHQPDHTIDDEERIRNRQWLREWVTASRRILDTHQHTAAPDFHTAQSTVPVDRRQFVNEELSVLRAPVTRQMLFGASRLIRDADCVVPGKKIRSHANRGLAGIDGTIATSLGIAMAHQSRINAQPGITRVILGDLAFLHDVGALLIGESEMRPRIQLIVGNDGGGTIFDSLEVAATAPKQAMRRVLYTPQDVSIEALANAYGWGYSCATTRATLEEALVAPTLGPTIIEVPLNR
jgi:2-succinyl-5-enolpyruvyl-6-hydroxy-3-cyclohexene-1-carboxylate synthase